MRFFVHFAAWIGALGTRLLDTGALASGGIAGWAGMPVCAESADPDPETRPMLNEPGRAMLPISCNQSHGQRPQSSAIAAWDAVRGGIVSYHIGVYFLGQPEVGTTLLQFAVPRAFTPRDLTGSQALCRTRAVG